MSAVNALTTETGNQYAPSAGVLASWQVESIVSDVFSMMMSIEVTPVNAPRREESDLLTAMVRFAGQRSGALFIECTPSQVCWFAGQFTGLAASAVNAQVLDTFGELANIIGVNVKSLLQSGLDVSLPSILQGSACAARIARDHALWTSAFQTTHGVFWVTYADAPNRRVQPVS